MPKLKFSPQAAAAMAALGSSEVVELSTDPNPLECPNCRVVKPALHEDDEHSYIKCGVCNALLGEEVCANCGGDWKHRLTGCSEEPRQLD